MAGRRKASQELVIPTNSLVASAVRYPGSSARIYTPSAEWQKECYRHYNICGEARYAANYFGHALSRSTLYAATPTPTGLERAAADSTASKVLSELFNGPDGQAQMLTAIGIHLTVAGECYLVGRSRTGDATRDRGAVATDGEADIWEVVSTLEMKVSGTKWAISYGDGMADVELGSSDVVIRIWRPLPARRIEADSPFRSLLPILNEIEWLTMNIFSQIRSRLAGAGIMFVSQGLTFPPPPEVDGKQQGNEAEGFMYALAEAMMRPIADPSSPSAMVPLIVTVPPDMVGKAAELMHFWSDLDSATLEMRQGSINRFALGMDLPPEKVLGMSSNAGSGGGTSNGVSHWGAWQIDEDSIKLHVEPMLEVVVNAITIGYLRPVTEGIEVVRYDTTNLRLRPDRSKESMELYDRGVLKAATMLRENGFDAEDDAPDEEELKAWLLKKIAGGSATPEQVDGALKELGVDLGVDLSPEKPPRESRPEPSLEDHPSKREPDAAALMAAADALCFRALERAGNRIRQFKGVKPPGVPAHEMHTLYACNGDTAKFLDDAWSCAPQVLEGLVEDVPKTIGTLNAYVTALMATQIGHDRARLSTWLEAGVL